MIRSISAVTLATHDMARALRFYNTAGFPVIYGGADADNRLTEFLSGAGALADPVLPYVYAPKSDPAEILALIGEIAAGRVDTVAFTSAAQVARLFEVAQSAGEAARLSDGLEKIAVAAVGPVVAGELQRRGFEVAIMPRDTFFMKPLVSAIAEHFSG